MSRCVKSLLMFGAMLTMCMLFSIAAFAADVSAGKVTGGSVNVRSGPGTTYKLLTQLTKGTDVLVIGKTGNWYKIGFGGKIGYMSSDFIKTSPSGSAEYGYGLVLAETLLYDAKDYSAESSISLPAGSGVKITAVENGWYAVKAGAHSGYLPGGAIEPTVPTNQMISAYVEHSPGMLTVEIAKKYLGIKYRWGGLTPATGFDCSGFVEYVFKESHGFSFKQRTAMYLDGVKVKYEELLPGDVVFFCTSVRGRISHVGIYIGDGKFIHSPRPGKSVMVTDMSTGLYKNQFYYGKRVIF